MEALLDSKSEFEDILGILDARCPRAEVEDKILTKHYIYEIASLFVSVYEVGTRLHCDRTS
jgi:hypothetical protein